MNWVRVNWVPAAVVVVGLGGSSCSLPPREAWQRVKEEGVLKAFFVPKRGGAMGDGDRTQRLAGADLSVEGGERGASGVPVAEVSDRPGYVYSPRTPMRKLVDVRDFRAGETVLCPYTMEPFRVPGGRVELAGAGADRGEERPGPRTVASARNEAKRTEGTADAEGPMVEPHPAVQELTVDAAAGSVSPENSSPVVTADSPLPFGLWVEGKPGLVYSPFADRHQLVDVTGLPPGTEVRCPFSDRIFRVPESESATTALSQSLPEPAPAEAETPTVAAEGASEAAAESAATPSPADAAAPEDAGLADAQAMRELATPEPAPTPEPIPAAPPAPGAAAGPKYGATQAAGTDTKPAPVLPEPESTPAPASPAKEKSAVKPKSTPKPAAAPSMPTAVWVPGKPGLVQSPFGRPGELVDVTGKPTGSKVVCPYTNKPFLVPKP